MGQNELQAGLSQRGNVNWLADVLACMPAIPRHKLSDLLPWHWQPHGAATEFQVA